jgi:cytidylate kinase
MPDADLKIYLDASVEERARRRYLELKEKGEPADYDDVLIAIKKRDTFDSERKEAPLRPADDAFIIDTTEMSVEEVLAKVEELIEKELRRC